MADIIKRHDDDVIFSYESLQEFIRLIQRQGINNLTIYSVNELLTNNKYETITTRMPPPTFPSPPLEFSKDELTGRRNYFVFVRYSFPWEDGGNKVNGVYVSNNEKNGRHVFIQTVNDIKFYKTLNNNGTINTNDSSVFHQDTANTATIITEDKILDGNKEYYNTNGTFTITIDNTQYVIKIRGFNDNGEYTGEFKPSSTTATTATFLRGDGSWTNQLGNSFLPTQNNTYNLGTTTATWKNLYLSGGKFTSDGKLIAGNGTATNAEVQIRASGPAGDIYLYSQNSTTENRGLYIPAHGTGAAKSIISVDKDNNVTINGNTINGNTLVLNGRNIEYSRLPSTTSTSANFWRGDGQWSNTLDGTFKIEANSYAYLQIGAFGSVYGNTEYASLWYCQNSYNSYQANTLYCDRNFSAPRVYNAVFNDYAECRKTIDLEPGRVVQDNDDGSLSCASQRLIPGCHIISDTYGNLMGETEDCKTPIAVAGRVLVYTYQPRENYHAGMSVCAASNGTVDIMTREEIINYPDCIIGTVSEIPNYETWGTDNVNVNGRIWIYVK